MILEAKIREMSQISNVSQHPNIKPLMAVKGVRDHLVPRMPTNYVHTDGKESTTEEFILAKSADMAAVGYRRFPYDWFGVFMHNFHHLVTSEFIYPFDHHYFLELLLRFLDSGYEITQGEWTHLKKRHMLSRVRIFLSQRGLNKEFLLKYVHDDLFSEEEIDTLAFHYKSAEFGDPVNEDEDFKTLVTAFEDEVRRSVEIISFSDEEMKAVQIILPKVLFFLEKHIGVSPTDEYTREGYWNRVKKKKFSDIMKAMRQSFENPKLDSKVIAARELLKQRNQRVFEYFYTEGYTQPEVNEDNIKEVESGISSLVE